MKRLVPVLFMWWFTVSGISASAVGPSQYNPITREVTTAFEPANRVKRTDPHIAQTHVRLGPYPSEAKCIDTMRQMTGLALVTVSPCEEKR